MSTAAAEHADAILPSKRMLEGPSTHHAVSLPPTRARSPLTPFPPGPPTRRRRRRRRRRLAMETDRQLHLREEAVRLAELQLVKRTLDQCALTEGVNALENCDGLVRQYLRMMKTHKVRRTGRLSLRRPPPYAHTHPGLPP